MQRRRNNGNRTLVPHPKQQRHVYKLSPGEVQETILSVTGEINQKQKHNRQQINIYNRTDGIYLFLAIEKKGLRIALNVVCIAAALCRKKIKAFFSFSFFEDNSIHESDQMYQDLTQTGMAQAQQAHLIF